jgi:aldehyde dehydrogenase
MIYSKPQYKAQYENFIGGEWVAPTSGEYFDNISPVDGEVLTRIPRSNEADVEAAILAADKAFQSYKHTSVAQRSILLNKIADAIEANLEKLAIAETLDNGKAIRETLNADVPLVVDHFRYFASVIRAESGTVSDLDEDTISQEIHEPYGVVAQIIPWNFPLLMAAWKLAPAIAAGNCVVMKPASATPMSILLLMEVIQDILPKGVINIINGAGGKIGKFLSTHPLVKKVGFTGETTTGQLIMQYATENIIPSTLELGGKSPNIFMESIMDADDEFFDKAIEGLVLFAFNSGEVCTCPSRALIQESIYEPFMARVLERVKAIKLGNPLDTDCMMGAQCSLSQKEKISDYLKIGKEEKRDKKMSMVKEFKDFAVKGNVVDMAVGIIIGAAFGKIITALVSGVIMPPIGILVGGVDFSDLVIVLKEAVGDAPAVVISYGSFIQTVIDFTIIAFSIFMVIKGINSLKKKEEKAPKAPPVPSVEETLLTEIRDLLKAQSQSR